MSDIQITDKELRRRNIVDIYGNAAGFSKPSFWYYTSLDTAMKIIENRVFHVNTFSAMNDKAEANMHGELSDRIHALCFCNSNTEKIPMWYLYAGLSGEGVSIGITPARMLSLIKSIQTVTCVDSGKQLRVGYDFEVDSGWVYYRDFESRVNYRNKWYRIVGNARNFEKHNYFIKAYPWEYEKEFRIIINTKKKVGKIAIEIPEDLMTTIKVKFGPEIGKTNIEEKLIQCEGFRNCKTNQFLYSNLNIKMNLYERNKEGLVKYIRKIMDEEPDNELITKLRETLK